MGLRSQLMLSGPASPHAALPWVLATSVAAFPSKLGVGAISRGFSSSTAPRAGKKTNPMHGAQTPR